MTDPQGFLKVGRVDNIYRPTDIRVMDYDEVELQLPVNERELQASRCMDCGTPFCHWGCPVSNLIPEWQDKLHKSDWKSAYELLQKTINFPEFTGRVCPAPCEASCVLAINADSVTIRANELAIIEHAFEAGYVQPNPPLVRTGKKVAVIGSGPAGLACADNLNKLGHTVMVYEAADALGGYLRYGIPDFKLKKSVIDRRVGILELEGLEFKTGVEAGVDIASDELIKKYDAICIAIGTRIPRDLQVEGRELKGVHFAVDYLTQQNKDVAGHEIRAQERITAKDKHVVVIGGGDTGSDCVGTSNRQAAKSVTQLEILLEPPQERTANNPWPLWPHTYTTSSSQKEGGERHFSTTTKKILGGNGRVNKLSIADVTWEKSEKGGFEMSEVPDTEKEIDADLVLLAMGFVHVMKDGLVNDLGITLSSRGNIQCDENYMTNVDGVFTAGDAKRGPSLIVWAFQEGRESAGNIHKYLMDE
ncbi:MAG: glutamate synthase subunit beta [Anaerolineae bacterium]|nr:glutamate synthase subunit beta [Anaerolineae bacterium]